MTGQLKPQCQKREEIVLIIWYAYSLVFAAIVETSTWMHALVPLVRTGFLLAPTSRPQARPKQGIPITFSPV